MVNYNPWYKTAEELFLPYIKRLADTRDGGILGTKGLLDVPKTGATEPVQNVEATQALTSTPLGMLRIVNEGGDGAPTPPGRAMTLSEALNQRANRSLDVGGLGMGLVGGLFGLGTLGIDAIRDMEADAVIGKAVGELSSIEAEAMQDPEAMQAMIDAGYFGAVDKPSTFDSIVNAIMNPVGAFKDMLGVPRSFEEEFNFAIAEDALNAQGLLNDMGARAMANRAAGNYSGTDFGPSFDAEFEAAIQADLDNRAGVSSGGNSYGGVDSGGYGGGTGSMGSMGGSNPGGSADPGSVGGDHY